MDGFAYDDFARAAELIAIGEQSMRAALPALKKKLRIMDETLARPTETNVAKANVPKTPAVQTAT